MFRTVPLSIVRSFSLYTQQWYMSYSLRAGAVRNVPAHKQDQEGKSLFTSCQQTCMFCCVYSEKLLMMDRGTVRNM